jgi:hypothetical protein
MTNDWRGSPRTPDWDRARVVSWPEALDVDVERGEVLLRVAPEAPVGGTLRLVLWKFAGEDR